MEFIRCLVLVWFSLYAWACSAGNSTTPQGLLQTTLNKEPPESLTRIRKLEVLKEDILRKLRLATIPEVSAAPVPDLPSLQAQVKRVQQASVVHEADDIASGAKLYRLSQIVAGKSNIVFFNLSSTLLHSPAAIKSAVLCVYVKKKIHEHSYRRTVFFMHDGSTTELLSRRVIKFRETGTWVYIDLTAKARQWLQSPETNHGVEVTCTDNVGASLVQLHARNKAEQYVTPVLEIEVSNSTVQRRKRHARSECEEMATGEKCCRYPLVVDFEELGWDFIIAPRALTTYSCTGECPIFKRESAYSYLTNSNLCCAPKVYSPVSVIYYDHNQNIIIGSIPGVVVNKCLCI